MSAKRCFSPLSDVPVRTETPKMKTVRTLTPEMGTGGDLGLTTSAMRVDPEKMRGLAAVDTEICTIKGDFHHSLTCLCAQKRLK